MRLHLDKYNNLTQRIITALVGAIVLIFASYYSEWTYFAVFFLLCCLTLLEFYTLAGLDGMLPLKFFGTMNGLLIFVLSFLIESGHLDKKFYFVIFPMLTFIFLIKLYKIEKKPFTNIAYTFLGILYIGLPFSLMNFIVFSNGSYNYQFIIGLLLLLWATDTGGYFAGVKFGKTKLFKRVSPKKTWEGMLGSFILAMIVATFLGMYFRNISPFDWYLIGFIIIIAATYGDLVESLFKRSIEIKDSGTVLPGHGGFLDRFDGLLLSMPFIIFLIKVIFI
jgi:phosphatidate cytidylyltransferase